MPRHRAHPSSQRCGCPRSPRRHTDRSSHDPLAHLHLAPIRRLSRWADRDTSDRSVKRTPVRAGDPDVARPSENAQRARSYGGVSPRGRTLAGCRSPTRVSGRRGDPVAVELQQIVRAVTSRHSIARGSPSSHEPVDAAVVFDLAEHRLDRDLALGVELAPAVGAQLLAHLFIDAVFPAAAFALAQFPSGGTSTSIPCSLMACICG